MKIDWCDKANEYLEQLEAAKQRELELLAVIEKQSSALTEIDILLSEAIAFENMSVGVFTRKRIDSCITVLNSVVLNDEPSKALREHEAKVLEAAAEWFDKPTHDECYSDAFNNYADDQLRRMAEERRKK